MRAMCGPPRPLIHAKRVEQAPRHKCHPGPVDQRARHAIELGDGQHDQADWCIFDQVGVSPHRGLKIDIIAYSQPLPELQAIAGNKKRKNK